MRGVRVKDAPSRGFFSPSHLHSSRPLRKAPVAHAIRYVCARYTRWLLHGLPGESCTYADSTPLAASLHWLALAPQVGELVIRASPPKRSFGKLTSNLSRHPMALQWLGHQRLAPFGSCLLPGWSLCHHSLVSSVLPYTCRAQGLNSWCRLGRNCHVYIFQEIVVLHEGPQWLRRRLNRFRPNDLLAKVCSCGTRRA